MGANHINERVRDHMLDELIEASETLAARNRILERALVLHHQWGWDDGLHIGDKCPVCAHIGLDFAIEQFVRSAVSGE